MSQLDYLDNTVVYTALQISTNVRTELSTAVMAMPRVLIDLVTIHVGARLAMLVVDFSRVMEGNWWQAVRVRKLS